MKIILDTNYFDRKFCNYFHLRIVYNCYYSCYNNKVIVANYIMNKLVCTKDRLGLNYKIDRSESKCPIKTNIDFYFHKVNKLINIISTNVPNSIALSCYLRLNCYNSMILIFY